MVLDTQKEDERAYRDIVEDARKRIPALAPAWTDHNVHDPGITILETLAWVTETYLYQLGRVDERHLDKYLRLLGESATPPVPARVRLALSLPAERSNLVLSRGTRVLADAGTLDTKAFSTIESAALTSARLARVVSEYGGRRIDNSNANGMEGLHFLAFGPAADAGSAMYIGFEGDPFEKNHVLDLWMDFHEDDLVKPASDPNANTGYDYGALWLNGDAEETVSADDTASAVEYEPAVAVSWQYCADYENWGTNDGWDPLVVVEDRTTDLYHGGRVRLALDDPSATIEDSADDPDPNGGGRADFKRRPWPSSPGTIFDEAGAYYWIRCVLTPRESRIERTPAPCPGTRPERDDEDGRIPSHDIPPQFEAIRLNVIEADHVAVVETAARLQRVDARGEAERTTALPGQTFAFASRPVLATELVTCPVENGEVGSSPEGSRVWSVVSHFDASGPDDSHVLLDEMRGVVTFGDGVHGRIPAPDQYVEARRYVHGGGEEGNVPHSATWGYVPTVNGTNAPMAEARALTDATGGREAESVRDVLARVRHTLDEPSRVISLSDYRHLALNTPGLRIGRATAAAEPEDAPAGCVGSNRIRLVVVPFSTRDRPEPSEGFLRTVRCHLRRHALLTDRVEVEPPLYVGVGVRVEVRLADGVATADRTTAIATELETFLNPFSGYDGDGWPFGRALYPSEVYEVVEAVPGVECVLDVAFDVTGPGWIDGENVLHIPETGLFYSLSHNVRIRTDRASCGGEWR